MSKYIELGWPYRLGANERVQPLPNPAAIPIRPWTSRPVQVQTARVPKQKFIDYYSLQTHNPADIYSLVAHCDAVVCLNTHKWQFHHPATLRPDVVTTASSKLLAVGCIAWSTHGLNLTINLLLPSCAARRR